MVSCVVDVGAARLVTGQVLQQRGLTHEVHHPNAVVAHPLHKRPNQRSWHLVVHELRHSCSRSRPMRKRAPRRGGAGSGGWSEMPAEVHVKLWVFIVLLFVRVAVRVRDPNYWRPACVSAC